MPRPITLFTGQWADLPFEEMCRLASEWGYDGLEIACWGDHLDVDRAAERRLLRRRSASTLLEKHGLKVFAISNHLNGQAVCDDPIDERHHGMRQRARLGRRRPRGRPAAGRRGDEADRAGGARRSAWTSSSGSPGRRSGRPSRCSRRCPPSMIEDGYADFADRWNPILDVFDEVGVQVRARGAPVARSPTTTGRRCARWRRSGTGRRSG